MQLQGVGQTGKWAVVLALMLAVPAPFAAGQGVQPMGYFAPGEVNGNAAAPAATMPYAPGAPAASAEPMPGTYGGSTAGPNPLGYAAADDSGYAFTKNLGKQASRLNGLLAGAGNFTSPSTSFCPNMIGGSYANQVRSFSYQQPTTYGPAQLLSHTLATGLAAAAPGPGVPVVFNVGSTTLNGQTIPATTFTSVFINGPNPPDPLTLTNVDAAYQAAFTTALAPGLVFLLPAEAFRTGGPSAAEITAADSFDLLQWYLYQQGFVHPQLFFNLPTPSTTTKVSDNNNPWPKDRVYADYQYFHGAALSQRVNVQQFVPGVEKTFLNGKASIEARLPIAVTQPSNLDLAATRFDSEGVPGNLQVICKFLLLEASPLVISGGFGVSTPTGPDVAVNLGTTALLRIANDSVHVMPFFAAAYESQDAFFAQTWVAVDVPTAGNPVFANTLGRGLEPVGYIYDQTLLQIDAMMGYWLFRTGGRGLSGMAAVAEVHYTGAESFPQAMNVGPFMLNQIYAGPESVDMTVGSHFSFGNGTLTLGYGFPVTDYHSFEGQLRAFFNFYF